jgi:hypothetical protein
LPRQIPNKSNFSKILPIFEVIDKLYFVFLCFLDYQFSFTDNIELISYLSLLDHILACWIGDFFKVLDKLAFFIRTHGGEQLVFVEGLFAHFSLLDNIISEDCIETIPIQTEQFS